MKILYVIVSVTCFLFSACIPSYSSGVSSPDGKIKLSFSLTNDKQMTYQVTVNDTLEIIMAKGGGQAITFIPAS